jgi:hypothetical protein
MAMGIDVVPIWNMDINAVIVGINLPDNTPAAMAVNIQSVKCLSRNDNLLFIVTPISLTALARKEAHLCWRSFRSRRK